LIKKKRSIVRAARRAWIEMTVAKERAASIGKNPRRTRSIRSIKSTKNHQEVDHIQDLFLAQGIKSTNTKDQKIDLILKRSTKKEVADPNLRRSIEVAPDLGPSVITEANLESTEDLTQNQDLHPMKEDLEEIKEEVSLIAHPKTVVRSELLLRPIFLVSIPQLYNCFQHILK